MATLALDRVVKRYGDQPVIHGVDLQVESGEFCVLVGPSGCGKSTLLRMIAGLEAISDGTVSIDGQRVNELSAAQRGLAMVFQSYALYPHMTVRQNLAFGLENLRTPRPEIDRRVQQAAQMLQIEPLLQRRPRQLSGGQRQRVAIGRAVVREPRIFLFDEPLSNLDAELRVQTRGEIKALHRRLGSTMIYVTHDQVEAMTMADRICVLRDGKVAQVGRPLDLYNRPASRFVGGFIGSPRMNFLDGRIAAIDGAGIDVAIDGLPMLRLPVDGKSARVEQKVILGVRPEHVRRAEGTGGFVAKVNVAEHLGSDSYLFCTLPGGQSLNIHRPGQELIRPDEQVTLMLDPDLCHAFEHDGAQAAMPRLRP